MKLENFLKEFSINDLQSVVVEKEGVTILVPLDLFDCMNFEEKEHFAQMSGCFGLLRVHSKINEYNEKSSPVPSQAPEAPVEAR